MTGLTRGIAMADRCGPVPVDGCLSWMCFTRLRQPSLREILTASGAFAEMPVKRHGSCRSARHRTRYSDIMERRQ